jgi:hypothetical protein
MIQSKLSAGVAVRCLSFGVLALALVAQLPSHVVADEKEKTEKKKFEMEKWPKGCGNPKWDLTELEEICIVKKGKPDENGLAVFLVELKEDMKSLRSFKVQLIDKEGVRVKTTDAFFDPSTNVKKGDVVRLRFSGHPAGKNKIDDDLWAKTAKVKLVQ